MTWIIALLKGALGLSESWAASQSLGLFGQFSLSLKSRTCYLLIIVLTIYHIHVHFGGFPCSCSWETRTGQIFLIIPISVTHRCIISSALSAFIFILSSLIPLTGFNKIQLTVQGRLVIFDFVTINVLIYKSHFEIHRLVTWNFGHFP